MIKIIIADDDGIIREDLKMIMETQDDIEVTGIAGDGRKAVELCRSSRIDVALLDIRMPDMNGIEAAKIILEENIGNPLLLTTFDEPDLILDAARANVNGYILKNSSSQTIISAIHTVALGGTVYEKEVLSFITSRIGTSETEMNSERNIKTESLEVKQGIFSTLTSREYEVASRIAQGFSNKEIADRLFISDGTVRNHISVILSKTELEHRTQIAIHFLGQDKVG